MGGETRYERSFKDALQAAQKRGTTAGVPKNIPPTIRTAKGKAKGWFFQDVETFPIIARGALYAQLDSDSCVAAAARMIAADAGVDLPEAYLRELLKIDDGGYLSDLPITLQTIGVRQRYEYRNDLTFADLQVAVQGGAAVVYLQSSKTGHAVVVEAINQEFVMLRDPLPKGEGRSYQVRHADFSRFFLMPNSNRGRAVIMVK